MDDIRVVTMQLPGSVRAFTIRKDDFYTIIMREDLSGQERMRAYMHEMEHIKRGDYDGAEDPALIEIFPHQ